MNLGEWLETHSGKVEIGAKDGSGFFFIGYAEMLNDNLEIYDKQLKKIFTDAYTESKHRLAMLIKKAPNLSDYLETEFRKAEPDISFEGYQSHVKKHINKVIAAKASLIVRAKELDGLKPLQAREIIEMNKSILDDGYIKIIVSGYEKGKYWGVDEVKEPFAVAGVRDDA